MASPTARFARALKAANWIMAIALAAEGGILFLSSLACHSLTTPEPPTALTRDDSLAVVAILKANGKAWPKSPRPVSTDQNGRAISLDLSGLGLETIPSEIGDLLALTVLDLSRNKLRRLPRAIEELTALETLRLGDNEFDSLPDGLSLPRLLELNAARNRLTALPRNIDVTSIRILALDENRIRSLPPDFRFLGQLVSFSIQGNLLDSLPASFTSASHPNLARLILADNNLASLPEGMQDFSLEYLNLARNRLCLPDTAQADSAQRILVDWLDASDRDWRSTQRCP